VSEKLATKPEIAPSSATTTEENITSYVRYLRCPSLVDALNGQIGKELHTKEAAAALCDYYRRNPKLKSLTLSKEITRLDYEFTLKAGRSLRKAEEIREYFEEQRRCDEIDDLVLRASNQTLIADLLELLMSDSGGVVRRQYLATAVATKCRFFVNMGIRFKSERKFVKCVCDFVVSIPGGHDGRSRLNLAIVRAGVFFSPGKAGGYGGDGAAGPLLRYQILGIEPCLDPERDAQIIKISASWLAAHLHHEENETHHAPPPVVGNCAPKKQQQSAFDFGLSFAKKSKLDFAAKVRSVIDTASVIDQQTDVAATCGVTERRRPSTIGPARIVAARVPIRVVPGVSAQDFLMDQLIIEQRVALCEARSRGAQEAYFR